MEQFRLFLPYLPRPAGTLLDGELSKIQFYEKVLGKYANWKQAAGRKYASPFSSVKDIGFQYLYSDKNGDARTSCGSTRHRRQTRPHSSRRRFCPKSFVQKLFKCS